jgi:hypothetical protein
MLRIAARYTFFLREWYLDEDYAPGWVVGYTVAGRGQ